jgi:hypothetical protein
VIGRFTALLGALAMSALAPAGAGDDDRPAPPPKVLDGARSVSVRTTAGGLQRFTTIPRSSVFWRHGGGATRTCSFTASRNGFVLSDGSTVPRGTKVTSHYLFIEGVGVPFPLPPDALPEDTRPVPSRGPLHRARRTFSVFCDRTWYDVNFLGFVSVPYTDRLLDPRTQLDRLYQGLQLERPRVVADPVVAELGGLLTRHPAWLAISPSAWRTQQTEPLHYRGAVLLLVAQPRRLDFDIDFRPDPARPSAAFRGVVGCLITPEATSAAGALPARPALPVTAEPGSGGPCTWTPPGPGVVTVTARVTYDVTFWANGYTQGEPPYVWSSTPTTFRVGELTAVNTDPTQ